MPAIKRDEFLQLLREGLPKLLREHPEVRHEVYGILLEVFPSRQEFTTLLQEIRALREDMDRRFEATRQEIQALREDIGRLELHMSALGLRVGRGLEHIIRGMVEKFSGQTFATADRLVLTDTEGEVFVKGAQVEFDLYASDGTAYLVEVKSHVEVEDVFHFQRKFEFAKRRLGREVIPMIIALSAEEKAERLMQSLGIQYIVRTHVS